MNKSITASLLSLLLISCAENGKEPYAGWDTFEEESGRFSVRYLSPPWTQCSNTEYEEDCHECPTHLLGSARCGGVSDWIVLWVPPALLDPDFLLIPPFKLEVSWFAGDYTPMDLAQFEQERLSEAGLEVAFEARARTLYDGTVAAEVGYRGPVHLVINETAVNRPDEREYRVVYVAEGGYGYRVALDTAIDMELPEVRDLMASFSVTEEP